MPRTVLSAYLAFLAAPLLAQVAPPAPAPTAPPSSGPRDPVVELSAFVITSEKDLGYAATSSLAGTRIRTELKDLANPISVVTREFMSDVHATDPVELLVYTANTEAGGVGGNYSGAALGSPAIYTEVTRQPQNNNRVRGLARADLTRDYFPTVTVFDGYNTARVEINRGPNATLFGLGSPGGIINTQLIQPELRNSARVETNLGSFGTARHTLDVDRVLIPGRFGVRVAGLDEREQFQQKFAYERDRRAYAAVRLSILPGGALRASLEKGAIDANRPRSDAPRDNLTRWWTPPFNKATHSPGTVDFNLIDRDILRAPGEWFAQPAVVYESPSSATPARVMLAWNTLVGVPRTPGGSPALGFQANMVSITKGDQWFPSATAARSGIQRGSFYADDAINDFSVFDWRNELLDGPNKREWERFQVGNVGYEHTWRYPLGTFGVETAFSRETMARSFFDMFPGGRGYNINIDVNTTLPWGVPNPNFGRPFVASNNTRATTSSDRRSLRGTAFGELDFARVSPRVGWLGRHQLTGFASDYQLDESSYSSANSLDEGWVGSLRATVNPATSRDDINSDEGMARTVVYIGPSLAALPNPRGIALKGIQSEMRAPGATGWYWDSAARQWRTRPVVINHVLDDDVFSRTATSGAIRRQRIDSQAFVYQGRLLRGEWIVGTLGWRKDRVEDFRNNLGQDVRDRFNFLDSSHPAFRLPAQPDSVFEQSIWSRGIVLQRPPFLRFARSVGFSLHYSRSENFQPASARIDTFGKPIMPPGGLTEDRGFSLTLLEGRLQAKFNWYQTDSVRSSLGYQGFLIETDARIVRYNTPAALAAAGYKGPPDFLKQLVNWQQVASPAQLSGVNVTFTRPGNMSDTESATSKGFEFESTFNPTSRLRLAFNASQQEAMRANIAPATREYLKLRIGEWTTGATGNLLADESGQPVRVRVVETLLNAVNATLAREGQSVSELRRWRFNAIGNYTFARASLLGGWNVGGAVRWQDKVAVGYPIIDVRQDGGTIAVPDLTRPYLGPAELKFDGWIGYTRRIWRERVRWSVQLNVRDLLNDDELVPVMAQPDGSIASWVAPQGRVFNLRSTFEF